MRHSRIPFGGTFGSLLLSFSLLLPAPSAVAAPEAFEVNPEQTADLPRGKEADGIIGDFVLRNNKIEAVISGNLPNRRANMSTFYGAAGITPGCLYDLTLRGANNDQITVFCPANQQGPISWTRVQRDGADGEASVETVQTAPQNSGLYRKHEYRLKDDWQGVLITTTFRNDSKKPRKVNIDDRWTNFSRTGQFHGISWADAVDPADLAGYAYAVTESSQALKAGQQVELAPGQSLTWSRFLAVGKSPAEAAGIVASRKGETGRLAGKVADTTGKAVSFAQVSFNLAGQKNESTCVAYTDAEGRYALAVPAGDYEIEFIDQGRGRLNKTASIKANETAELNAEMPEASAVVFEIRDDRGRSTPCKVQFHGVDSTKSPNFGPSNRARGCVDQYHSEKGDFRVALNPGKYKIIVTRGIEYSHIAKTIELTAGETEKIDGVLKRLVDTTGWVSADYHNHSTPSGDNTCGTDDRLINLAAEQIEFAPTTEHNRLYDWRPHIDKLGLKEYLQTVPGMELTGSGAHFNSFPFKPEPFLQDNGAPVWNKDPRITAITLRDWQGAEPDRWIQINHPDMVDNFIDRDADGEVDGGFLGLAMLIDGIETQNYSASELLDGRPFRIAKDRNGADTVFYSREFIWLQMLNRGHRYAAMAVNDAHAVYGNGVGAWRMFMPSKSDEPAEIDWRENCRHAKAGRSILTTGPFLQVHTDDGILPGGSARSSGPIKLKVKAQCADWIDIDRVQVLVNGRPDPKLNFTRKSHPSYFSDGVVKFERALTVPLTEDAHLIVVAVGENSDLSIGYGTSAQARIKPFAYNNPIFVDVDGSGFTPNGDSLGWPLPVKKLSVEDVRKLIAGR